MCPLPDPVRLLPRPPKRRVVVDGMELETGGGIPPFPAQIFGECGDYFLWGEALAVTGGPLRALSEAPIGMGTAVGA